MAEFLEERISERIRYGSVWRDEFSVEITTTAGGAEHRRLVHPYPVRVFAVSYVEQIDKAWDEVMSLFRRAHGRFAGFRLRCFDEDSTNGRTDPPTATDQAMALVSAGVYQIQKAYGTDKAAISVGHPVRTIYKPVAGSVLVAVAGVEQTSYMVTPDHTAGTVTFRGDEVRSITGITKATQAVVTVGSGHPYINQQSVHISGVAGMTQINGKRAKILSTNGISITLDLDTTGYSTYTSGGTTHSRPQPGEAVTAGCRFDFPVRFDSTLPVGQDYPSHRTLDQLQLIELLKP